MENWLPVVRFEGLYVVSDYGNIKSIKTGRVKKYTLDKKNNRPFMNISKNGKAFIVRPHTLVLTAFVGIRPKGLECCHNDGNPWNNRLENLRWDTTKSNQLDRAKHGTSNRGERCASAKLTETQVLAIRLDTRLQREISIEYGVTQNQISRIKNGIRWAHSYIQPP